MSEVQKVVEKIDSQIADDAMGKGQEENVRMVKVATKGILSIAKALDADGVDPTIASGALIACGLISLGGFVADGLEDAAA
jgi:hypothetical protein